MDVLTARGLETLEQEREAADLFCSAFLGLGYVSTPKHMPCIVDAMIVKNQVLIGVVEMKCRQMTLSTFEQRFNSEWLVTLQKLEGAANIAAILCVPLVGALYLVPDRILLVRRLWEPNKGYVAKYTIRETETQATVNGGLAIRENAFIDMSDAKQIRAITE